MLDNPKQPCAFGIFWVPMPHDSRKQVGCFHTFSLSLKPILSLQGIIKTSRTEMWITLPLSYPPQVCFACSSKPGALKASEGWEKWIMEQWALWPFFGLWFRKLDKIFHYPTQVFVLVHRKLTHTNMGNLEFSKLSARNTQFTPGCGLRWDLSKCLFKFLNSGLGALEFDSPVQYGTYWIKTISPFWIPNHLHIKYSPHVGGVWIWPHEHTHTLGQADASFRSMLTFSRKGYLEENRQQGRHRLTQTHNFSR